MAFQNKAGETIEEETAIDELDGKVYLGYIAEASSSDCRLRSLPFRNERTVLL
jgi:hypothetical protein